MRLGPYELVERIGAGGMGEVWRARDAHLHRDVAVKILPPSFAANREWKERFLREARIAARLNHPGIVTVYSVADLEDTMYIAMELVDGRVLREAIEAGDLSPEDVCRIGINAAMALHEAHRAGVIHRDVKPENIVVTRRGVKVLDFGLARDYTSADPALTRTNAVFGTPLYMSPEQALGRKLDARSDIFSLGAVLYEALSGLSPFESETAQTTLLNVVTVAQPPLHGVPAMLAEIVDRCLEKSPENRFPTALDLAEALRAVDFEEPVVVSAAEVRPGAPRPRALVVDDDELVRVILQGMLADVGFAVDEASDGSEAIRQLKSNEYEAMFLDLLMPRVDGWTVLDYLRGPRARKPRRVYVTSGMRDLKLSHADASVVTQVLSKPLKAGQMMELAARISA